MWLRRHRRGPWRLASPAHAEVGPDARDGRHVWTRARPCPASWPARSAAAGKAAVFLCFTACVFDGETAVVDFGALVSLRSFSEEPPSIGKALKDTVARSPPAAAAVAADVATNVATGRQVLLSEACLCSALMGCSLLRQLEHCACAALNGARRRGGAAAAEEAVAGMLNGKVLTGRALGAAVGQAVIVARWRYRLQVLGCMARSPG